MVVISRKVEEVAAPKCLRLITGRDFKAFDRKQGKACAPISRRMQSPVTGVRLQVARQILRVLVPPGVPMGSPTVMA
jgi:hypothetical protein